MLTAVRRQGRSLAFFVATALLCGCAPAKDPSGPWRAPSPDPIRLAFDGTVLGADNIPPEARLTENVHLNVRPTVVQSGDDRALGTEVSVHLAPGWFLDERGLHFEKNREIHVEGPYKREEGGKIVVTATRARTGTDMVELRDAEGNPLWEVRKQKDAPESGQ